MSLYDKRYFFGSRHFQKNKQRLIELSDCILKYSPKKLLDVGCGIGFLVNRLRDLGVDAYGVDSSTALRESFWGDRPWFSTTDAKTLPFKDKEFDVVFSSDFLEHIPEEDIDKVISEMKRVGKTVVSRIAYEDKITKKQAMYHLTNKPEAWWREKLVRVEII